MVKDMVTTNGKVIKISSQNYKELRHTKYKMELNSINDVVSILLQEHCRNSCKKEEIQ